MFGWFSKEKTQNWRKELKTQGNNSKLKEKTQNSRKKLSFPAFPKTMNGRKVHKQKACFRGNEDREIQILNFAVSWPVSLQ